MATAPSSSTISAPAPPPSSTTTTGPAVDRHHRPLTVDPASGPIPPYPIRLSGKVIAGFGRGSKELGIPTANIPISGLDIGGHAEIQSGIYYGWAGLQDAPGSTNTNVTTNTNKTIDDNTANGSVVETGIYPMVMSIGWNPYYKNTVRSVEVHLIHQFGNDFYGARLNLIILGYIRPEFDYVSREALIEDILFDVEVARTGLERENYAVFREDGFLRLTGDGEEEVEEEEEKKDLVGKA
ncbi:MAG: riboflavin kinase [Peltula sp. TS41687]|nr:MAG: riboflavin kinase [Peltula sp. TS41687]